MKFRAEIQGLRAFAVLLVISHHFFPETIKGGFFGVDIFFVISGYIITLNLMKTQSSSLKDFLVDFYGRRVRRIIPSALLVIALSVSMTYYLLGSITGSDTALDGIFATLFLANFHFNSLSLDYFASGLPQPILQHYWSLAIEEQFYLAWPLLFFVSRRALARLLSVIMISLGSFLFAINNLSDSSTTAYFSTFSRIWELGIGAALALSDRKISSKALINASITFLLGLSLVFSKETDFPGFPTLLVALLAGAIIVNSQSNRILGSKALTWIGDRSYTLYLVHWPVYQITKLSQGDEPSIGNKVVMLFFITVISAVVFRYFENPLRHSESLKRIPALTIFIGICLSGITIILLTLLRSIA